MTPQRRDKGLQRGGRIPRPPPRPRAGRPGDRSSRDGRARASRISSTCFGPCAPQVTRTQRAAAVLGSRAGPNSRITRLPPILSFHGACAGPYLRRSSFHISSARPTQLTGFRLLASMIRYTRYAVRADAPLTSQPGPEPMAARRRGPPDSPSQASRAAAGAPAQERRPDHRGRPAQPQGNRPRSTGTLIDPQPGLARPVPSSSVSKNQL